MELEARQVHVLSFAGGIQSVQHPLNSGAMLRGHAFTSVALYQTKLHPADLRCEAVFHMGGSPPNTCRGRGVENQLQLGGVCVKTDQTVHHHTQDRVIGD